ncbi:unnamed protein product [Meloidogyne enterolobii]|uniref:Uncharacterized protein n=1 Tax=Meloidogyne enterolobii TaxID=390850 RepID=A0ACB0ZMJ9_MELEN
MAEYTFRSKREEYRKNKNVEETMPIILEKNNQRQQKQLPSELNNNNIEEEKQKRRKSSTAIINIHKNIPKGPAPLVRVDSLIELTTSSGGCGCSSSNKTFGNLKRT